MNHHRIILRNRIAILMLMILVVASLAGCAVSEADVTQENTTPQPVSEPASGTILSGYAPEDASNITVSLESTGSCVVMLKDASDRTLLSFYVRAGDTVQVNVPAEMMYVQFAGGTTWYGEDLLFGENTVYNQDSELTDFAHYSWEYELDPLSVENFTDVDFDESEASKGDHIDVLNGEWESASLTDGNSSLNISAMAFSEPVYNCIEMTINMEVKMNAGTSCKDWQVWGRTNGSFVKLEKIYLAEGDGYTSQTITFDTPVSFDAIAISPTIPGGYSWSIGFLVTDVWMSP